MSHKPLLIAALLLNALGARPGLHAQTVPAYPDTAAQGVYKCPLAKGGFEYTDRPCIKQGGKLILQPTDTEAIDNLLYAHQPEQARAYATEHHVETLYQQRLESYQQRMAQVGERQQRDALAAKQRADEAQQRAQAAARARTEQLADENALLRDQNARYREDQGQGGGGTGYVPAYGLGYSYYGYGGRPRRGELHHGGGRPDSGHDGGEHHGGEHHQARPGDGHGPDAPDQPSQAPFFGQKPYSGSDYGSYDPARHAAPPPEKQPPPVKPQQ